jgi:hypothetical protein
MARWEVFLLQAYRPAPFHDGHRSSFSSGWRIESQHFAYSMFNACLHGCWPTDDKGVARMHPSRQDDLLDGKGLRLLNGQREGMA